MRDITVKIINTSGNSNPEYATPGSSGMDIRASIPEPVILHSLERKMIPTGIFLEIPFGFEAQVRPRSGMAIKKGITCLNSPGTVDSDYRGEIKIILINLSNDSHTIQNGDRIAQMVFCKIEKVEWQTSGKLEATSRGEGGFGHTGNQ